MIRVLSRVTSRSKELIHIELVDMRKMNELMEAHRLIFENVLTSMVMVNPRGAIIRCNRHAEQVRLIDLAERAAQCSFVFCCKE
jgi:PAS domain-containing protein